MILESDIWNAMGFAIKLALRHFMRTVSVG